ncbi:MAG: RNase adapter RapZ [Thermodesulfovibrionales bacterium]|nr:RNase adapter RapZ [Thermodesulfovibrionales bacterium]
MPKRQIVIVTGLSGSGKSVALRALEDGGYFCVDNFPLTLLPAFLKLLPEGSEIQRIGIGVDVREKDFLKEAKELISSLKKEVFIEIIFLEADPEVIKRRYRETRRPHPLGDDLDRAIEKEKKSLLVLRDMADRIQDTSNMSPHELRHWILTNFSKEEQRGPVVTLISFGYKYGIPQNIDMLFDVRFLPNPYFVPELSEKNGLQDEVRDFVLKSPETKELLNRLSNLLEYLIPQFIKEGKNYIVIAVGCTGGKHRSPVIVEELKKDIEKFPLKVSVIHRELT